MVGNKEKASNNSSTFCGLIFDLLGCRTHAAVAKSLPNELKYVFIAISCPQGPLNGVLVASSFASSAPPAPSLLSFLPRSPRVWSRDTIEECFLGESLSRRHIFNVSKDTEYLDLQPATAYGCTAFVSLGKALPCGRTVAVVLGFKQQEDCSPLAIRTAELLLESASGKYRNNIVELLEVTELLIAPPPVLPPSMDDDLDFLRSIEEEWDSTDSDTDTDIPAPDMSINKYLLNFKDPSLEAAFAALHNASLFKVDLLSFPLCLVFALCILFVPQTKFKMPALADGVQAWRCLVAFLPMVLLINPRLRAIYYRHREVLITYTYCTSTLWNLHVKNFMDCLDPVVYLHPLNMLGYPWLIIMILTLQLRFKLLLPLTLGCSAVVSSLLPRICSLFFSESVLTVCIGREAIKLTASVLAGPLLIVWWLERCSRRNFTRTIEEEENNLFSRLST